MERLLLFDPGPIEHRVRARARTEREFEGVDHVRTEADYRRSTEAIQAPDEGVQPVERLGFQGIERPLDVEFFRQTDLCRYHEGRQVGALDGHPSDVCPV